MNMSVIFNNYTVQDIFDNMSPWLADGVSKANQLPQGVWKQKRDEFLTRNRSIIEGTTGAGLPLNDMANYYTGIFNSSATENIGASFAAWEKVRDITDKRTGSGIIYGWDTETFGDIQTAGSIAKGAGVTELGISRSIYENGMMTTADHYSILIKMNSGQVSYVESVMDKLRTTNDWNALTKAEQVTLDRISMYRTAKADKAIIDYMGGGTFETVSHLSSAMGRDLNAVRAGLNFMKKNGSDLGEVLPKYLEVLRSGTKSNVALAGANTSNFDRLVLMALGVSKDDMLSIDANTADITMGQREIASAQNITTFQLNEQVKGDSLKRHTTDSNTVSAMNESLGYQEFAAHEAGADSFVTSRIVTTHDYMNGQSFAENVIESHRHQVQQMQIMQDSVVLVNNGYLDKNAMDQVRIGDQTTHSYSINGSYWLFDEAKSGTRMFTPEGKSVAEEVFIASFKSAATGEEDIEFSKMFANEEAFNKWMAYNTTILGHDEITQGQIDTQARYHSLDFGRREYDRFFESNSAARAGRVDEGGYASMVKYLKAYDAVNEALTKEGIEDQAKFLRTREGLEKVQGILSDNGLKYNSQQRAFVGMYGKLQDESEVLRYISQYAENHGVNNITKTVIAHDMHEEFITQMNRNVNGVIDIPYDTYTLSDVYSIDLLGSDGKYHTVRGNTANKLASGIRYLYENESTKSIASSLKDMQIGVEDLYNRGLLDESTYDQLVKQLQSGPSLHNASTGVANALDGIFQPFRNHSAITVYKQVMNGTNEELSETIQQRIIAKNVDGPVSVKSQRMYGTRITTINGNNVITANDYFRDSGVRTRLDTIGQSAVKQVTFASNLTLRPNDEVLENLAERLGYSDTQKEIVAKMFNATQKKGGEIVPASYAINTYKDEGLVSALVTPNQKGNSGYIVLTNAQHANQTYGVLSNLGDTDLTYDEMVKALDGHASIFELKAIHKVHVGDIPEPLQDLYGTSEAITTYVNQGNNSIRYSHPALNLYVTDGIVHGGLKEAGTEVLSAYRIGGANAIKAILEGDFEEGSRIFKRAIDAGITGQSGTASNQGIMDEVGNRIRGMNFNLSDVIHGSLFEYGAGYEIAAKQALTMGNQVANPLARLLYAFNEGLPDTIVSREEFIERPMEAYETIMNSPGWKEFEKRHLNEAVGNNDVIQTFLKINPNFDKNGHFNKTLFDMIADMASEDTSGVYFDENVREALRTLQTAMPHLSQNLGETHVAAGMLTANDPGTYFAASPGAGINRPTFVQQLHARNMLPEALPQDYLARIGSVSGPLTITPNFRRWMELDDLVLPDGTKHASQISSITTTFKQLSDEQLQARYRTVKRSLNRYAKETGMDVGLLREAFDAQVKAAPTVYGDNLILSSSLATAYHEAGLDTKKIKVDRIARIDDDANLSYTRQKLASLEGKLVRKGDIIGHDSRGAIYWDGLETVLTKKNIEDILTNGETVVTPTNTIASRKFMIAGAEKAVANGVIVNDEFLKAHGFQSKEQAHQYLDFVFEKVLGVRTGTSEYIPSVAGNLSVAKHISGTHLRSPLNLIVNEYKKAGQLDVLAATMSQQGYGHWSPEALDGMLFVDTVDSHYSFDMTRLMEDVRTNHIGTTRVNKKLTKLFDTFEKNNLGFLDFQSSVQNQIMGDRLRMDPRVEAAIRRRNMNEYWLTSEGGLNGVRDGVNGINGRRYEDIMMDEMRRTVVSGQDDYIHAGDLGRKDSAFNQAVERISKQKNASLIKQRRKLQAQEKVVAGIAEASRFFSNPNADLKSMNIVTVSMDELLKEVPTPSRENLSHFIFKPNGKYSAEFIRRAKAQGVDLASGSLTVAVDLGREFTIGSGKNATKVSKVLVPLYDIYDDFDSIATKAEDTFFVKSQADFMYLMRTYQENINHVDDKSISKIAQAISRYRNGLAQELATDDKTSLAFKTFGRFILPNSTYLLGQDEIAAVTEDMLGLSTDIDRIQEAIRKGSGEAGSLLRELSDAYGVRSDRIKGIAEHIKSTGQLELHGNVLTGHKGFTVAANGGFLNVNAVNRNTFEQRLGFDIGLFGKSLFDDIKSGSGDHYMSMGKRTFKLNIAKAEEQVVENLNKIKGFTYTGNLARDIDSYMITIKDLNAHLLETKGGRALYDEALDEAVRSVNQAFDFIGEKYLKEIGITTRLTVRHPAFAMGIGPANIILDDSVGNEQLRILGPGYSKTMNLDHDGDTLGLAIHDAANAMRKSGKNALEIKAGLEAIERNALDDFKIITEMIADGEAFKRDNISDVFYNESIVFKTYDKKGYEKARSEFLASIKVNEADYAEEAVDFLAAYSPQMRKAIDAYNMENGNFLKSAQARIAALKAKTNKENIGIISNASFALHDAVATAFSKTTDEAKKKRLAELHSHMDYISTKGMDGLMTIAEQKGIDTKHILNATEITNVNLFSKGMRGLMNTNTRARNNNLETSMVNIMQSVNHALFQKGSRDELIDIAKDILNTTMEQYQGRIDAAQDLDTVVDLMTRRQLRALYELSEEAAVRTAYNSPLRRFKDYETFMKGIADIEAYDSGVNVASKARGAYEAASGTKLNLDVDTLYVTSGGLHNADKGYVLAPYNLKDGEILRETNGRLTLRLKQVGLTESLPATGRYKYFAGDSVQEIMDQVNDFFIKDTNGKFVTIATRDFKDGVNDTILSQFGVNRKRARAYNVLNDFFVSGMDTNIEQYFAMGGNRRDPLSSKSILKLRAGVGDEYFDLINRFAQTTQEDLWEIDRLHAFMGTKNADIKGMSYEGLIKAVNADIVNNPQNYANSTEFTSYLDVVESKLSSIVGADNYAKYRKEYRIIGDFDSKAYNQIVDGLRDNVYDIMSERQSLTEGIDSLKQYKKLGIDEINDVLKSRNQTIEGIIGDLTQQQTRTIQSAEAGIHALFSSIKQIDTFFDWSQLSRHSKVGFGEFIGYEFGALSQADIDKIFKYADENIARYTADNNTISLHAYEQTMKLLKQWTSEHAPAKKSAMSYRVSAATTDALSEIAQLKTMGSLEQMMKDTAEAMSQAEETVKKQTLTDISATKAKDIFDKLPKKAIGIGVATMAAIGIVNNALHNQKNQSPLTPARKPGGNTLPNYNSPATSSMPVKAPLSRQKTVYHDRGSGFNFKVSANTRNRIDDQNNAKLIGMSGGGNPSIYSQSDMSRVTNNWLANKFADLA